MNKIHLILTLSIIILFIPIFSLASQEESENEEPIEITITGTRTEKRLKDSPVITEIINSEEINNSSAKSLEDVLEDYGIQFGENPMGSYIGLQGMEQSRVLFLVDGRRITGRVAKRLVADTIPLENIERIEIVRGPQSALYGSDGIGGVINIITRKPGDELSGRIKATNSFLNPSKDENFFREQDLCGNFDFALGNLFNSLSLDLARSDYYLDEGEQFSILPKYYRGKAGLEMGTSLSDTADISFGGSFFKMRADDQTSSYGSLGRKDTTRADGHIEGDFLLGDNFFLSTKVYHNYYLRISNKYLSTLGWEGEKKEEENLSAGEVYGRFFLSPSNELTVGFEGAYNWLYKYNLEGEGGATKAMDRESIIVQDEQFKEDKYSVILGVRAERNSAFGYFAAPKLSGMYYLTKGLRALAGVGVGYRAPDFSELYLVMDRAGHPIILGNEDLEPEKSIGSNLGLEYAIENLFARINLFHNELFDELVYDLTPNPDPMDPRELYIMENIDRSYRQGADLEARITLLDTIGLSAGYNFVYGYNRTTNDELTDQPKHIIRGKISFDSETLGILAYVSGRYLSKTEGQDEGRTILDFYISKSIKEHFKIFAGIDNFTDTVDEGFYGPYEGIIFSLGIESWF